MTDPRAAPFEEWVHWYTPESGMVPHEVDYTPREFLTLWTPEGSYEIDVDIRPLIGFYLREDEYEDEEE